MKAILKVLVGVLLGCSMLAVSADTVEAQWLCGGITPCIDPFYTSNHRVEGWAGDDWRPRHGNCMICVNNPEDMEELDPEECHIPCSPHEEDLAAAYALVLQAAESADFAALSKLATELPRFVAYNPKRSAYQVRSCDGAANIANIPLQRVHPVEEQQSMAAVRPQQVGIHPSPTKVGHVGKRGL